MSSLPSSTSHTAPPRQTPNGAPAATVSPPPTSCFGTIASTEDASNGPHRDGRIRNPVPSKLKGKTDGSKGNFSVMHMEVAGRSEAAERDAEAKRTSESTELAAKRAFEHGYVSLRRSRFIHVPDEPVAKPFIPASTPASASSQPERRTPLNPEETKSEQARLLTLLRSLHPVLVVDQICKALAFFGGIPGAPPPADGAFPESAEANGPGSLFVGWVAEIFPKLGGNLGQQSLNPARQLDTPEATRRKRGRPKGSKATKSRIDKGVKKGPARASSSANQRQSGDAPDDSWVDVDDDAMDDVDANVMLLAQATSPQPQPETPHATAMPNSSARTALPGAPAAGGATGEGASSVRKRGRPKGSKNRPKDPTGSSQAVAQFSQAPDASSQTQVQLIPPSVQLPEGSVARQSFTAVNSTTPAPAKRKVGRPRGSGPKQQARAQSSEVSPALQQQRGSETAASANVTAMQAQAQAPTYQVPQRAQSSQGQVLALPTPPTASPAQTKASSNAGQKRKRKGGKDTGLPRPDTNNPPPPSPQVNGLALPTPPSTSRPPPPGSAGPPPPKRPRKEPGYPRQAGNEPAAGGPGSTSAGVLLSPNSAPNPSPRPGRVSRPTMANKSEPSLVSTSVSTVPQIPSIHSPQQNHFEVQSPTMENYEAQLQAQLEQHTETRVSQNHYNQNRATSAQYHQQPQQQHQNYVSSQTEQQQQFPGGQQHSQNTQVSSAQQYSTSSTQPQQYAPNQQQYAANQQQPYSGGQQQRYQHQLVTTSAATSSYTAQSPQFSAPANNNYNAADGTYRNPAASLSNTSYSQRNQPVAPSVATSFRTNSAHGLQHHSPSFGTSAGGMPQRAGSTNHTTTQSMQGLASVQTFAGNAATTDWGLFDAGHLDTSGHQGAVSLGSTNYGVNAAGVRAPPSTASAFASTDLGAFDTSGLGSGDRYYGVGRR
ncbi:hypothetical protein MMYC01_208860 [Madurella mycetomatis]|uniref:Uncharacterized protein n=1 Tax=Madurella mycetomatis TaxID=100816 RepID=A0A175VV76_9PEZI|nr:hypothetical protein MMYC01_208860 [Madurella mycetomatis]